jgi:uncharacterized protein
MTPSAPRFTPPTMAQRLAERERPERPAVMLQRWEQLAFLHWRFDPELIQRTLPPALTVDTFSGEAWVGSVPIFMRDVRPRFVPPVPYVSDFLELNLRTYVYDERGRPGVYFYSLACDQPLVVEGARRLLQLNYEHAEMKGEVDQSGHVSLISRRVEESMSDLFIYRGESAPAEALAAGTLPFFLIERYRLFAGDGGRLTSIRVHHAPYRIRAAEISSWGEQGFRLAALPAPERQPDHACVAETVELEVFLPEPVEITGSDLQDTRATIFPLPSMSGKRTVYERSIGNSAGRSSP